MVSDLKSLEFYRDTEQEKVELILNSYWRPTLSVIGMEGLPSFEKAGNVIYKEFKVRCSMRLPPTLNAEKAKSLLDQMLESKDDTFNSQISLSILGAGTGFNAPELPNSL